MSDSVVLVVDDDPDFRALVCMRLTHRGIEATSADSADEALQVLDRQAVSLVLTDLRMPGMDGAALRRRLATTHPDLPVVLWSGSAADEEDVRAKTIAVLDEVLA